MYVDDIKENYETMKRSPHGSPIWEESFAEAQTAGILAQHEVQQESAEAQRKAAVTQRRISWWVVFFTGVLAVHAGIEIYKFFT